MNLLDQSLHVFEVAVCAGCGDEVSIEFRTCYVSRNTTLCLECATRLGGRLDAWANHWSVAPDVGGPPMNVRLRTLAHLPPTFPARSAQRDLNTNTRTSE